MSSIAWSVMTRRPSIFGRASTDGVSSADTSVPSWSVVPRLRQRSQLVQVVKNGPRIDAVHLCAVLDGFHAYTHAARTGQTVLGEDVTCTRIGLESLEDRHVFSKNSRLLPPGVPFARWTILHYRILPTTACSLRSRAHDK